MSTFLLLRAVYGLFLLVTATLSWRFGGRSERIGVGIVVIASIATVLAEDPRLFDWQTFYIGLVIVDVVTLAALLLLAIRSQRFWPLWATAFQLIAVCGHGVVLAGPSRIVQAYALFQGFWAYPIMVAILVGALSGRGAPADA